MITALLAFLYILTYYPLRIIARLVALKSIRVQYDYFSQRFVLPVAVSALHFDMMQETRYDIRKDLVSAMPPHDTSDGNALFYLVSFER